MVLDASAVIEWLLGLKLAESVLTRMADPDRVLHAPHLLAVEVASVIRRYVRSGALATTRGEQALADLADTDIVRHPHEPLLPLIWRLRANLTSYDAAYIALAEALQVPLVTLDVRLADAPGHGARIDLVR
jgi:predicted nucleic acid-binding protein